MYTCLGGSMDLSRSMKLSKYLTEKKCPFSVQCLDIFFDRGNSYKC